MPNPKLETYKSKKTGVIYDYTDADAQSQLTGIKDGTGIDSFADVESALAGKASTSEVASRVDWESYAKTGVHNFLPPIPQTYTEGSLTVTKQDDGSFELNGSTGASDLNFVFYNTSTLSDLRGDFKFKLNVSSISGIAFGMYKSTSGSWSLSGSNLEQAITFTDAEHASGKVALYITSNKTFDHVLVKPTLTLASDTSDDITPYAMTNRELTEAVTPVESACTDVAGTVDFNIIRKIGHIVILDLKTTGLTLNAYGQIAIVPQAYRPKNGFRTACISNIDGGVKAVSISPDSGVLSNIQQLSSDNITIHLVWYV